ncbi:hypothetical protein HCN44_007128 [Aphidius gifuensis]|uniref:Odorant receptor n=1 Tax=Aphidius gifuensis TaxID=684658 RepID=A0A3S9LWC7_APHGI|nr:odorant receptor 47a-like [Aphidius gifuensis]AZQ24952.1 odorant receptor [Aphidius gifuensis]KAF7988818.1 hypothetical protein HCN44_007128 [Aphidius gifuensis]
MSLKQIRLEQRRKVEKCELQIRQILLYAGVYPVENPHKLYRCLWWFVIFVFTFNFMGMIILIIHHRKNLSIVLGGAGVALSLMTVITKGTCCIWYDKEMALIKKHLSGMMDRNMSASQEIWDTMIQPMLYYVSRIYLFIYTLGFALVLVMFSKPALIMLSQVIRGHNITYIRPYPTIYFWKIPPGGPIYMMHYFIDTACSWYVVSIGISVDNLFAYSTAIIMAHYRALNYEIRQFNGIDIEKMKEFVCRHQELNDVCQYLGVLNGPVILIIAVSTSLILCSNIFTFSKMETITLSQAAWPAVYTAYKLLQVFIFAWCGELLKETSEEFREAVYASRWHKHDNKKVAYCVRMMMNQKPILLNACGVKPVTADLFSGVANTAVSYFFLMQTISEKD